MAGPLLVWPRSLERYCIRLGPSGLGLFRRTPSRAVQVIIVSSNPLPPRPAVAHPAAGRVSSKPPTQINYDLHLFGQSNREQQQLARRPRLAANRYARRAQPQRSAISDQQSAIRDQGSAISDQRPATSDQRPAAIRSHRRRMAAGRLMCECACEAAAEKKERMPPAHLIVLGHAQRPQWHRSQSRRFAIISGDGRCGGNRRPLRPVRRGAERERPQEISSASLAPARRLANRSIFNHSIIVINTL